MMGTLVLCGTPIGNLDDASPRLAEALASADLVLAEDTRRARLLMDHLGVRARVESYFAGNEHQRGPLLESRLSDGSTVVLITDAGMPTVSDPGVSAVRVAIRIGAKVSVVPGPSASLAALASSGLASDRFVFEGFLPRKGAERSERLSHLAEESRTIVLFSATSRVVADLESLADALTGDRPVSVARELTKAHEEVWWGTLDEAIEEWSARAPRGEFTVVVAGRRSDRPAIAIAVDEVQMRIERGEPMSDAVRTVADNLSVRRRALYEAIIVAQSDDI